MSHTTAVGSEPKLGASGHAEQGFIRRFFADGARAWGLPESRLKMIILAVPILIAFSGVVAALMGKEAYKMLTGEDKIVETLQVVCWALSLGLTIWVVRHYREKRYIRVLYILLAVGIVFLIGEEVSWGQRIFGWSTPQSYADINKQDETNLHNIHGVGYTFKWLNMLIGAYGFFAPLLLLRSKKLAAKRPELWMLAPHQSLFLFFLMPFVWRLYRNLFDAPKKFYFVVSEYSEVMELVLAAGFVFFLLYQKREINRRQKNSTAA